MKLPHGLVAFALATALFSPVQSAFAANPFRKVWPKVWDVCRRAFTSADVIVELEEAAPKKPTPEQAAKITMLEALFESTGVNAIPKPLRPNDVYINESLAQVTVRRLADLALADENVASLFIEVSTHVSKPEYAYSRGREYGEYNKGAGQKRRVVEAMYLIMAELQPGQFTPFLKKEFTRILEFSLEGHAYTEMTVFEDLLILHHAQIAEILKDWETTHPGAKYPYLPTPGRRMFDANALVKDGFSGWSGSFQWNYMRNVAYDARALLEKHPQLADAWADLNLMWNWTRAGDTYVGAYEGGLGTMRLVIADDGRVLADFVPLEDLKRFPRVAETLDSFVFDHWKDKDITYTRELKASPPYLRLEGINLKQPNGASRLIQLLKASPVGGWRPSQDSV